AECHRAHEASPHAHSPKIQPVSTIAAGLSTRFRLLSGSPYMTISDAEVALATGVLRSRAAAHAAIIAGRLPTTSELVSGAPFFENSWSKDVQTWAGTWLDVPVRHKRIGQHAQLLQVFRDTLD